MKQNATQDSSRQATGRQQAVNDLLKKMSGLLGSKEPVTYAGWIAARHKELLGNPVFHVVRVLYQVNLAIFRSQFALASLLVERGVLREEDLARLPELNVSEEIKEKAFSTAVAAAKKQMATGGNTFVAPGELPSGVTAESYYDALAELLCNDKDEFSVDDTEKFFVAMGLDLDQVKSAFADKGAINEETTRQQSQTPEEN